MSMIQCAKYNEKYERKNLFLEIITFFNITRQKKKIIYIHQCMETKWINSIF